MGRVPTHDGYVAMAMAKMAQMVKIVKIVEPYEALFPAQGRRRPGHRPGQATLDMDPRTGHRPREARPK